MISIHDVTEIQVKHHGATGKMGWIRLVILTRDVPTQLTLYMHKKARGLIAQDLRTAADLLEGIPPPLPEGVTMVRLDDPEALHNTLKEVFND